MASMINPTEAWKLDTRGKITYASKNPSNNKNQSKTIKLNYHFIVDQNITALKRIKLNWNLGITINNEPTTARDSPNQRLQGAPRLRIPLPTNSRSLVCHWTVWRCSLSKWLLRANECSGFLSKSLRKPSLSEPRDDPKWKILLHLASAFEVTTLGMIWTPVLPAQQCDCSRFRTIFSERFVQESLSKQIHQTRCT